MSSLILKKNQLPTNGICFVDKTNGTSLRTWFKIICSGWIDLDGQIDKYEYMGLKMLKTLIFNPKPIMKLYFLIFNWFFLFKVTYSSNQNPIVINYNSVGIASIQLPQGPESDSYKIYLFVNIIDDSTGTTVYLISTPVVVTPNDQLTDDLTTMLATNDPSSQINLELNSGNLNLVAKNVIALTSVFNIQSRSNSSGNISEKTNKMADLREFMVKKVTELSVTDISSVKVISSALSVSTQTYEQITSNTAVFYISFSLKNIYNLYFNL